MATLLTTTSAPAVDGTVALYKSPGGMCCEAYANYLHHHGFEVTDTATHDLSALKEKHGVPEALAGCHTAFIDGYVFEGHIPVDGVRRVLEERPAVGGIGVPAMPAGSPGMPGGSRKSIRVWTFANGTHGRQFTGYRERPG